MSRFFCDSNCELNYKECEKYNVTVIKMPYTQNGIEKFYDMGRDSEAMINFYKGMRAGDSVVTNALNPQDYISYFEPVFAAGEDILYVHFSSNLSGTFTFMHQALEELHAKYPDRQFKYVDTKGISMSAGLVVNEAAKMHANGVPDDDIIKFVESFRDKVRCFFMVDDLDHLKKGGRISSTTAFFGRLLGIKPVIAVNKSGKLEKADVVKGRRRAIDYFVNKLDKIKTEETFKYPIVVLHADCGDECDQLEKAIRDKFGADIEIWHYIVGPTIGTHCGPGTLAICFVGKERES